MGEVYFYGTCLVDLFFPEAGLAGIKLLKRAGVKVIFPEGQTCCGMAGSYSLKLPEISAPILERKLKHIKETGATKVVMDCPGCVMQIRGGLDKDGAPIQTAHTAELLSDRFL